MAGFKDLFIPRETAFFEYLKKQVSLLHSAIKELTISTKPFTFKKLRETNNILNKYIKTGDSLFILVTKELHQTFITPIDRDEIQTLSFNLNRVLHSIETVIASVEMYRITRMDTMMKEQIKFLQQSVSLLATLFQRPLAIKENQTTISELKEVESKADVIFRKAVSELFAKSKDPIEIIKKKELLKEIEETIDKTEYIANIMQNVLINHA
jgi:uncharacterized protein